MDERQECDEAHSQDRAQSQDVGRAAAPVRRRTREDEREDLLSDQIRAELAIEDEIGLAMRASRRLIRSSQRRFAELHGWSASQQARIEARAGDLAIGQVRWMLASTEFVLCLVQDTDEIVAVSAAEDITGWVVAQSARTGLSTRALAERAGTSQTMVARSRSVRRVDQVSLGVLADIVRALGGAVRLAWNEPTGPALIAPEHWPNAAVLPMTRGAGRRFPAHEWLRRARWGGPWWYFSRYYLRGDGVGEPRWTTEAAGRWTSQACVNVIAPASPAPRAGTGPPMTVTLPGATPRHSREVSWWAR